MKIIISVFLLMLAGFSHSSEECRTPTKDEVDIIYINGIDTPDEKFKKNIGILKEKLLKDYKGFSESGSVHNPSWGVALDVVQSLAQIETEFIVQHSDQNFELMIKDVRELSFLMRAVGAVTQPGSASDPSEFERYYITHGKFPTMGGNDLPHALGNNYAFQMLKRKYELDSIHFYENQFKNSIPEVHETLMNRLYNNLNTNRPFVLLGHSQGTIVAKQAYNVLMNSLLSEDANHFQKDLFGRYEIASMNEWSSDDHSSEKLNYMVLWSDWVQHVVKWAMFEHSNGYYSIVGPTDPSPADYTESVSIGNWGYQNVSSDNNWKFYSAAKDITGHGVANYTRDYDELVARGKGKLEGIIGALQVCNKPIEPIECEITPDDSGSSGTYHFEKDLGNSAAKITWKFNAIEVPDAINIKLNGKWIRRWTPPISGEVSGEFFIEDKETGSNILDIYIVGNDSTATHWNFTMTCPS